MAIELTAADMEDLTPGEIAAIKGEDTEAAAAAALAEAEAASTAAERADEKANDKADADDAKTPAAEVDEDDPNAAKPAEDVKPPEGDEKKDDAKAEPTADALQAVLDDAEPAPAPAAPKPITFAGISQEDYKKEAGAIATDKGVLMKQLMDGEIDAEAFAAKDAELAERRDKLTASFTLSQANRESEAQRVQDLRDTIQVHVKSLMAASAVEGSPLDYNKDVKAQKQFDMALRAIGSDPDNVAMTAAQAVAEADRVVRALRNIAPTAAAAPAAPTPKVAARDKTPPPITLSGIPAAAPQRISDDIRQQFNRLSGDEAEEFVERLSPRDRMALQQGGNV